MSGHNKWSTIKHKKGAADAKRGKIFSKIIKEMTVAARLGGGDPANNPRLRAVIDKAKAANMPQDNVTRAIKKGTGEIEGVTYEEITYEGYGVGGVAILIECMTDNIKRTVSEIRHLLAKNGGSMGEAGSVAWMFDKKGVVILNKEGIDEEKLMEVALEAGASDIKDDGDVMEVVTEPSDFDTVKKAVEGASFTIVEGSVQMVPKNTIAVAGEDAEKILKLMDALEDHDDVQNVWANFDIDEQSMNQLSS